MHGIKRNYIFIYFNEKSFFIFFVFLYTFLNKIKNKNYTKKQIVLKNSIAGMFCICLRERP